MLRLMKTTTLTLILFLSLCGLLGCQEKERDMLTGKWVGDWYLLGRVVVRNDTIEFKADKKFKLHAQLLHETPIPLINASTFTGNYSINTDTYPYEIDLTFKRACLSCVPVPLDDKQTAGIFKLDDRGETPILYINPGIQEGRRPMPDTLLLEKGPVFVGTRKDSAGKDGKGLAEQWIGKFFLP